VVARRVLCSSCEPGVLRWVPGVGDGAGGLPGQIPATAGRRCAPAGASRINQGDDQDQNNGKYPLTVQVNRNRLISEGGRYEKRNLARSDDG
jgi:hypothetical protein